MKCLDKFKKVLLSKGMRKRDFAILLLAAGFIFICYQLSMPLSEAFETKTQISLGYSAKQDSNENYFVLDNSHERLICFDKNARVKFSIENPSDDKSSLLYIDDFCITDDGIYLSATQWDEMSIAREVVLFYDSKGKYKKTLVDRDYSELSSNKHRFYGISEKDGEPQFIECYDDKIVRGELEIPYEDAFNSVSDAVFVKDKLYVLDKKGIITEFDEGKTKGRVIYTVAGDEDQNIVPYRLAANSVGRLYFTDIKEKTVRALDAKGETSSVVCSDVDSLTVNFAKNDVLLLLSDDGLTAVGKNKSEVYLELSKNIETILIQLAWLASIVIAAVLAVVFIIRVIAQLKRRKYNMAQIVSIWVMATVFIVAALVCTMLMNSFADSYRDKIEEQVKSAAYMVANEVSGNDIQQIEADGGFAGDSYERLYETMKKAFSDDVEFYKKLYCNILKLSEDGKSGYAVAYLDQSIGSYFPLDEVEYGEVYEVYETGKAVGNQEVNDISGTYLSIKVPVFGESGEVQGCIAVGVETYVVTDNVRAVLTKILASIVIMLMLVWLVSLEAMAFANNYSIYRKNIAAGEKDVLPGHLIRFIIFLVFTAYNMTATFLPVYLMKKTDIFPEGMREMLGALPITVNIFIIGVMSLFCANLVRKHGIRLIMIASVLFSFAGNLCIFLFPSFAAVSLGLVLDGIGVGLITNAVYVMLTYLKDEVNRSWGLTIYNGACFSGINFGMMLGSMLAVSIGQRMVFVIVAAVWLAMILFTGVLVNQVSGLIDHSSAQGEASGSSAGRIGTGKFVFSKPIISFIALIQNPYIIFGSFVFYYVPIYCDASGYGETVCSVLIMLYSMIAVIGSDGLTEWISKKIRNYAMYAALVMNIAALIIVGAMNNIAGMVIALLLMGVGAAFGKPVQQNYYLELDKVKKYGEDRAIGIYNFTENIGESLGPVVFGRMLMASNFFAAIQIFCTIMGGAGFLHYIMYRKELKRGKADEKV